MVCTKPSTGKQSVLHGEKSAAFGQVAPATARRLLVLASIHHVVCDGIHALVYPLLPVIASELGLSYAQASLVRASFNFAGAAFQLPAGLFAERVGEYVLLTVGNAWLALGLVAIALSTSFIAVLGAAMLGGLGGNVQHPVGTSLVSRLYDGHGRGRAIGTINFSGDIGKLVAPAAVGVAAAAWGWRPAMIGAGITGVGFVFLLWVARVRPPGRRTLGGPAQPQTAAETGESGPSMALASLDPPGSVTTPAAPRRPARTSPAAGLASWGITHPWALFGLMAIGVLDSSVRGAALTLLPFLLSAQGLSTVAISGLYTVIFAGGAIGKFVCGVIVERFGTLAMIWITEAATAAGALLFLFVRGKWLVPLALVFGFALNGTSSVLYAGVAPLVPAERRPRVYGLYYTATIGASAVAPVLYGALGDRIGLVPSFAVAAAVTLLILPLSLASRRHLK